MRVLLFSRSLTPVYLRAPNKANNNHTITHKKSSSHRIIDKNRNIILGFFNSVFFFQKKNYCFKSGVDKKGTRIECDGSPYVTHVVSAIYVGAIYHLQCIKCLSMRMCVCVIWSMMMNNAAANKFQRQGSILQIMECSKIENENTDAFTQSEHKHSIKWMKYSCRGV